jgi:threonine dehydrogenase-like Zn-dependent dehydrogenase
VWCVGVLCEVRHTARALRGIGFAAVRQLTFLEPRKLEWRDVAEPELGDDRAALVRPLAVATCDLDLAIVRGISPMQGPFAFGHECVAEVIEVGEDVGSAKPRDVVSIPFQVACGECDRCRRGLTGSCENVPRLSLYGLPLGGDYGGFFSDVVRVPYADAMLVAVPEGIEPAAVASLSDNMPDAWRCVAGPLEEHPGAAVLICGGAGSIPLYATAMALALGAERVDYAGGRPWERERAERLGANLLDEEFPERLGSYPITIDASADHEGLACALRSTEPWGVSTSIGIYWEPETPVPLFEMFSKGITFHTGAPQARPIMPAILDLVRDGRFKPQEITAETAEWDEAAEAVAGHDGKLVVSR